jgi:hypothetical protein
MARGVHWAEWEMSMKTKLLAVLLLGASSLLAGGPRVAIGVNIGGWGYPPPVYAGYGFYDPYFCPGPGYSWVSGYWYGGGPRRAWRRGYWAPPRAFYGRPNRGWDRNFDRRGGGRYYDRGRRGRSGRY